MPGWCSPTGTSGENSVILILLNVASDVFFAYKKAVSKQNSASVTACTGEEGYSKTQRGRGAGYLAPTALYAMFLGMTQLMLAHTSPKKGHSAALGACTSPADPFLFIQALLNEKLADYDCRTNGHGCFL
jgi:hypothetical protein